MRIWIPTYNKTRFYKSFDWIDIKINWWKNRYFQNIFLPQLQKIIISKWFGNEFSHATKTFAILNHDDCNVQEDSAWLIQRFALAMIYYELGGGTLWKTWSLHERWMGLPWKLLWVNSLKMNPCVLDILEWFSNPQLKLTLNVLLWKMGIWVVMVLSYRELQLKFSAEIPHIVIKYAHCILYLKRNSLSLWEIIIIGIIR